MNLSPNFSQTFLPDRRLISLLVTFAEKGRGGNKREISELTGIPTGESTGKVEPIIYFSFAMGLIKASNDKGVWRLELSDLGSVVIKEDRYLKESVTLWLVHLLLCRRQNLQDPPKGFADAWFTLFADGKYRLPEIFLRSDFQKLLLERYGDTSYLTSLSGVVLNMYFEDACMAKAKVLVKSDVVEGGFIKQPAPTDMSFYPAYAAYLYLLWDDYFIQETQISLRDFAEKTYCFAIMGWNDLAIEHWLTWMVDKGFLQIDRYTGSPIILRLESTLKVLDTIYSELI